MIAKLYIPKYPLNRFIESFFYYTAYTPEHNAERFIPDGNVHLIFDLTDYPKYIFDNVTLKEIQSCKNVWFSGFRTEPITIPSGKESEMLIVNFHKGKSFPFLCEPVDSLTNFVVDAELVFKSDLLDLREQLIECKTIEKKFQLIEANFLKHYLNNLRDNPFVDFAINIILKTPTKYSIKEISNKVGYSQKHLIKIFREHVGVTPKNFLKVTRFQNAILEIEKNEIVKWSDVAFDCGFYDQSHFISDFKKFSGLTPVDYMKEKGCFLNYIPIREA